MSIIYQSLTKLRSSVSGNQELKPIPVSRGGRRACSNRLITPRVLLLAALVFSTGIGVSYGIYQIQVESQEVIAKSDAPWSRPASEPARRLLASTAADAAVGSLDAPADVPSEKGSSTKKLSSKSTEQKSHPTTEQHASKPTGVPAAKPTGMASGATVAGIVKETSHVPAVRQKVLKSAARPAAEDMERIRRANMRRSLDISRLIADIQQSMGASDHRRTQRLLEELAGLKGHDDPFVMKLRSYWYTQQGNLNRAAALLQEVLQYKPNDLEAGLNMAIIEIKTGQIRRADERLSRLRELYPEDTRIPELMEKLKS